jgi:hypothetical protein
MPRSSQRDGHPVRLFSIFSQRAGPDAGLVCAANQHLRRKAMGRERSPLAGVPATAPRSINTRRAGVLAYDGATARMATVLMLAGATVHFTR